METLIIPKPQILIDKPGTCKFSKLAICKVSGLSTATLNILRQDLPSVQFEETKNNTLTATFIANSSPEMANEVFTEAPSKVQGYSINITPKSVQIRANDPEGLWCGIQTLLQLIDSHPKALPCIQITDWPVINQRGIHIDLKGYQPKFERLLEECRILAKYKINVVLLEVEDKYEYACAPDVGIETAYTFEQFRELSRYCEALFISIMPKLQCLGHASYLLKHDRYRHLRENENPNQYCPRNDEGMELWRGMAKELMDCFAEHNFFHIGADETGNLGECPICREFSKGECYIHRVGPSIDFVVENGKQPVMWDDILRNSSRRMSDAEMKTTWDLCKKATLMYWYYYEGESAYSRMPEYLKEGFTVWGASGFSGCGTSWAQNVPPTTARSQNISTWTKIAIENKLPGLVSTGWTRIASADPPADIPEACWFTALYAAESMWSGKERELEDFCRILAKRFYGPDFQEDFFHFLMTMNPRRLPETLMDLIKDFKNPRLELFSIAALIAKHVDLRDQIHEYHHIYAGQLGHVFANYRVNRVRNDINRFKANREFLIESVRRVFGDFYMRPTIDEFILTRFATDGKLIKETEELLDKTTLE